MTDMVERAARAMYTVLFSDTPWEEAPLDARNAFTNYARAALEAAFKVTDEDADIFFGRGKEKSGTEFINHGWLRDFKTGMQALSDAALGEGS